jgi:hypothetical protein
MYLDVDKFLTFFKRFVAWFSDGKEGLELMVLNESVKDIFLFFHVVC